jgi:hypothetical protein
LRGDQKFVPRELQLAPRAARLALLRGICDTDAGVEADGRVTLNSTSEEMILGVMDVARSLGGRTSPLHSRETYYTTRGSSTRLPGRTSYRVALHVPEPVFLLKRKAARLRPDQATRFWDVVSVRDAGNAALISLTVDSADARLVAGEYLPLRVETSLALATITARPAA